MVLAPALLAASVCFGSVSHGRIEGSVALPLSGANFSAYSTSLLTSGRQFVHARVADVVLAAYADLNVSRPGSKYMFGETGLAAGGQFKPHKTHQNGLSVDFFVPVRGAAGQSVLLPTGLLNRFGYDIEFDGEARYGGYRIDFDALGAHLFALQRAAARRGVGVRQVIFDTAYLPRLFATEHGPFLREHLQFMRAKPWVRHDEHFHVDFDIPCKPFSKG